MEFTKSTKRAIDYTVPSILGCAAAGIYFNKTKDKDLKTILLILLIVFVLTYVVTTQITKQVLESVLIKKIDVPVDSVKIETDSKGQTVIVGTKSNLDISAVTKSLRDDLYDTGFWGHDDKVWFAAASISDEDLANVNNEWINKYSDEHSETLLMAIKADYWIYNSAAFNSKEIVVKKLQRLGAK